MAKYHLFDPSDGKEINLAMAVASGEKVTTPSGLPPLILNKREYDSQPADFHLHPLGYPCFKTCDQSYLH